MRFFFVFFACLVTSDVTRATIIYSSPEALLSSGDIPRGQLRPVPGHIAVPWVKLANETHDWFREEALLLASDFSETLALPDGTLGQKLKKEGIRFLLQTPKGKRWVEEKLCSPTLRGKTILLTKAKTLLRVNAENESRVRGVIPAGTFLKTEKIVNHSAEIHYLVKQKSVSGWINLYDTFTLLDFASQVTTLKNPEWRNVTEISGSWLTLDDGSLVRRRELKLLRFRTDFGVIRKSEVQGRRSPSSSETPQGAIFHFGEKVRLEQNWAALWQRAGDLKGQRIWFRENEAPWAPARGGQSNATLKDLLARGLFDLAEAPGFPAFKIASAQGVFVQTSEDNWRELSAFGKRNYPVAIDSEKNLYVGIYKSSDGGKHFEPYLRWDQIMDRYQIDINRVRIKSLNYDAVRAGIDVRFTAGGTSEQTFRWFVRDLKVQRPFAPVLDRVKRDVSPAAKSPPKWVDTLGQEPLQTFVSN